MDESEEPHGGQVMERVLNTLYSSHFSWFFFQDDLYLLREVESQLPLTTTLYKLGYLS